MFTLVVTMACTAIVCTQGFPIEIIVHNIPSASTCQEALTYTTKMLNTMMQIAPDPEIVKNIVISATCKGGA